MFEIRVLPFPASFTTEQGIKSRLLCFFFNKIFVSSTDVSAPVFLNCPSNIVATADRGTRSTQITWFPPNATDNSGLIPNITSSGKRPGEIFLAGEHNVRYVASDETGNVGECKFKIYVLGDCLKLILGHSHCHQGFFFILKKKCSYWGWGWGSEEWGTTYTNFPRLG